MSVQPLTIAAMGILAPGDRYEPWVHIQELGHVRIEYVDMGPGVAGATDGHSIIYLRKGLRSAEFRSVLTHELAHITERHTDGCIPRNEARANLIAARRLIDIRELADVLIERRPLWDMAMQLDVIPDMLRLRLDTLTDLEYQHLGRRCASLEWAS